MGIDRMTAPARLAVAAVVVPSVLLAACSPQTEVAAPQPRPVRTATIEKREAGVPITLTGRIEAEDEVALAFRISGRVLENNRKLGDRLEAAGIGGIRRYQRKDAAAAETHHVFAQGQDRGDRRAVHRCDAVRQLAEIEGRQGLVDDKEKLRNFEPPCELERD